MAVAPAAGDWLMTFPEATVGLNTGVIAPTVNVAAMMLDSAVASTSPTTFGTVMVHEPPNAVVEGV